MTELKLINGGAKEPTPFPEPTGTRWWEYVWMFAVSGIVWAIIGYWIYGFFVR